MEESFKFESFWYRPEGKALAFLMVLVTIIGLIIAIIAIVKNVPDEEKKEQTNTGGGGETGDCSLFPAGDTKTNVLEIWPKDAHLIVPRLEKWGQEQGGSKANWGPQNRRGNMILLHPGEYDMKSQPLRIPFMTSLLGLGLTPADVVLKNCIVTTVCDGDSLPCPDGGSTQIFWRDVQNLTIDGDLHWFTSQACPVRRLICTGNVLLDPKNAFQKSMWSSGGFLSNVQIGGYLASETQQQFCFKNIATTDYRRKRGMNMVFVNSHLPSMSEYCKDGQAKWTPNGVKTHGKPFLRGNGTVCVPGATAEAGPRFLTTTIVEHVRFVTPDNQFAEVQRLVQEAKAVVLTPGFYQWNKTLDLTESGSVLLGIGWPVLNAGTIDKPLLRVRGSGIHVAGIVVDAGPGNPDALVSVEGPGAVIHDLVCRATLEVHHKVACVNMVRVSGDGAYLENAWLWRADHGPGIEWGSDKSWDSMVNPHAITVTGKRVVAIGLFAEHQSDTIVQWDGEDGAVYFYQSEFPYTGQSTLRPSYVVGDHVKRHLVMGAGIYYVIQSNLVFDVAMQIPDHPEVKAIGVVGANWNDILGLRHTLQQGKKFFPAEPMTKGQRNWVCA